MNDTTFHPELSDELTDELGARGMAIYETRLMDEPEYQLSARILGSTIEKHAF